MDIDDLEQIITGLDEVKTKLRGKSPAFFEQVKENFDKYGDNIRLSRKQTEWLESLYDEHVNGVKQCR